MTQRPGLADGPLWVVAPPSGRVIFLPERPRTPIALALPVGDVVVVAGLPGAGKTTLLRAVAGAADLVFDPEDVALAAHRLVPGVPYRMLRPSVHLVHRARVLQALRRRRPGVVIHEPGARRLWRRQIISAARRTRREVHLVVLAAEPAVAAAGRAERRRTLPDALAALHEREWTALRAQLDQPWATTELADDGFTGVIVIPRTAAASIVALRHEPTAA